MPPEMIGFTFMMVILRLMRSPIRLVLSPALVKMLEPLTAMALVVIVARFPFELPFELEMEMLGPVLTNPLVVVLMRVRNEEVLLQAILLEMDLVVVVSFLVVAPVVPELL